MNISVPEGDCAKCHKHNILSNEGGVCLDCAEEILSDPQLLESIEKANDDIKAGRIIDLKDLKNDLGNIRKTNSNESNRT